MADGTAAGAFGSIVGRTDGEVPGEPAGDATGAAGLGATLGVLVTSGVLVQAPNTPTAATNNTAINDLLIFLFSLNLVVSRFFPAV